MKVLIVAVLVAGILFVAFPKAEAGRRRGNKGGHGSNGLDCDSSEEESSEERPTIKKCKNKNEELGCGPRSDESCDAEPTLRTGKICKKDCYCKEGMARIKGVCSPRSQCPKKCPKNKSYREGNSCLDSCISDRARLSVLRCPVKLTFGCFCDDGLKELNGKCVSPNKCSKGSGEIVPKPRPVSEYVEKEYDPLSFELP